MSCLTCGGNNFSNVLSVCRVCSILDGDTSQKQVTWCDVCSSYICKDCIGNWDRRARAAAMNWVKGAKKEAKKVLGEIIHTFE